MCWHFELRVTKDYREVDYKTFCQGSTFQKFVEVANRHNANINNNYFKLKMTDESLIDFFITCDEICKENIRNNEFAFPYCYIQEAVYRPSLLVNTLHELTMFNGQTQSFDLLRFFEKLPDCFEISEKIYSEGEPIIKIKEGANVYLIGQYYDESDYEKL